MGNDSSRDARLLALLNCLRHSGRPLSKREIQEQVLQYQGLTHDNFEGQFQNDKETLHTIGIALSMRGMNPDFTYEIDPKASAQFQGENVRFDATESRLISMAIKVWDDDANTTALKKLALSMDPPETSFSHVSIGLDHSDVICALSEAITHGHFVSFDYTSESDSFRRSVAPRKLVMRSNSMYLWGFDMDRYAPRLFKLSRIASEIEVIGDSFDAEDLPEIPADPFTLLEIEPLLAIRDDASLAIRAYVQLTGRLITDGWCEAVGLRASRNTWMTRVLTEGEDVVVLAPQDLRDEIYARIDRASSWGVQ